MNHIEAVDQMAVERYLLNDLTLDAREAFEEHAFECPDCALDLRASTAFVDEAKAQLPELAAPEARLRTPKSSEKRSLWRSLWRPAFVAPAFAAMLAVIAYQNVVTVPSLRESAAQPRLAPLVPLRPATRGATRPAFTADRARGLALPIELSGEPGAAPPTSYAFDLRGPKGELVWTGTLPAPPQDTDSDQPFSLTIPGRMLRCGSYSLTVSGIDAHGTRSLVDRYNFDIVLSD